MSRSITELLKNITMSAKNPVQPEGQLYNPDIPDMETAGMKEREKTRDNFYSAMKLSSMPRNGNYFSLGRNDVFEDPRKENFMLEGAIDPNQIRRKTNPDRALPNLFSAGSQNSLYQAPPDAYVSTNNVDLIQEARKSYSNYRSRFDIPQPVIGGRQQSVPV